MLRTPSAKALPTIRSAKRLRIDPKDVTEVTIQVKLRRKSEPVVLTELHRGKAREWVARVIKQGEAADKDMTTTQAASLLGVSRPHVIGLIDDGVLSCHKVGSHRRLLRTDVLRLRDTWERRRPALASMVDAGQEIDT